MLILATLSCVILIPMVAQSVPRQPIHAYASEEGGVLREYTLTDANASQAWWFQSDDQGDQGTEGIGLTLECRSGVAGEHAKLVQQVRSISEDELVEKNGLAYIAPEEKLDVLGESFQRTQKLVRVEPTSNTVVAFYVPEGAEPEEDYKIQLRYVDIAKPDDGPIDQRTVTMKAEQAKKGYRQRIAIPTSIKDGSYVLIPGQVSDQGTKEGYMSLWHSYYAPERSYTIYYRSIDDPMYANTVVTKIETIYGTSSASLRQQVKDSVEDHAGQLPVEESALKATLFGAFLSAAFVGGCALFVFFVYRKRIEDRMRD